MKALRYHGNKDIRLDEIPEPELRPGYVKIKNGWAGVCGLVGNAQHHYGMYWVLLEYPC